MRRYGLIMPSYGGFPYGIAYARQDPKDENTFICKDGKTITFHENCRNTKGFELYSKGGAAETYFLLEVVVGKDVAEARSILLAADLLFPGDFGDIHWIGGANMGLLDLDNPCMMG